MAQKEKRQKVARRGGPSSAWKNNSLAKQSIRGISTRVNVANLPARSRSARSYALNVLSDLRRNPSLTFTQAAKNRGVKRDTIHKYLSSALRRDSSGRIKARPTDRFRVTLYIPSTKPSVSIPIRTKNNRERQVVGQWMAALNAAGRGDFSFIRGFKKGQTVDGVLLPTGPFQIQKILDALDNEDNPYESLYRTLARPS